MNKHIFAAGAAVLAIGFAGSASAASQPCPVNYPHPAQAKQIKAALVQAFVSCNNPGGNTPNATTETGSVPTCFPATTGHQAGGAQTGGWFFGAKGKGDITFKAGKNKVVHPLNVDASAVDLYISVKLGDIQAQGEGLADNSTGRVQSLARATLIDRAANNTQVMTVVDFPTGFGITASNGKVNEKTSATVLLNRLSQPALPRCTTIELVNVRIKDPNTAVFASIGTFLP